MTNEQLSSFSRAIEAAVRLLRTRNPAVIRDHIVKLLYPNTFKAAEGEGALHHFFDGLAKAIRAVLKQMQVDGMQGDLGDLYPQYFPYIRELKHQAYFVPSLGEYLSINELIDTPTLLDEARRFLRKKGEETIAEAERLDDLYKAVTAKPPRQPQANRRTAEHRPQA